MATDPNVPVSVGGVPANQGQTAPSTYTPGKDAFEFNPLIQLGRTGLKQYGGFVSEEFLPALRGKNAIEAYKEMISNSGLVWGILYLFDLAMRGVEKFVEPYSDEATGETAEDTERAERVRGALDDMENSWPDVMSEISTMLGYGFAPMEVTYKKCQGYSDNPGLRSRYSDGLIFWSSISLRAQDTLFRWDFDDEQRLRGMYQLPPPDYVQRYIPSEKLLLFRTQIEKNNPEGRSLLRAAYFDWIHVKRLTEFESIKGERDSTGVPVIRIPAQNMLPGATADQVRVYNIYKQIARDLKTDDQGGIVLPSAFDANGNQLFSIEILQGNGRAIFDYNTPILRHEVRMAMCLLNDAMMIGHDKVGSYALADSKTASTPEAALNSWLDSIYEIVNRIEIPRVFALNGWPTDRPCKLKHGEVRAADVERIANAIQKLTAAGMAMFPDEDFENHIREEAGWPKKSPTASVAIPAQEQVEEQVEMRARRKRHEVRERGGKYSAGSAANVASALELLAGRQETAANGSVHHGFKNPSKIPFDPKAMTAMLEPETLPLRRVSLSSLVATQPSVRRETVRSFLENPGLVPEGHRDLTGKLVDRPIVSSHAGTNYIVDGHHRLSAKKLLGYDTVLVRVLGEEELTNLVMKEEVHT